MAFKNNQGNIMKTKIEKTPEQLEVEKLASKQNWIIFCSVLVGYIIGLLMSHI